MSRPEKKTRIEQPDERNTKPGEPAEDHVAALSAMWKKAHDARVTEIESGLLKQRGDAGADEGLLLRLAAHDAALAERLGEAELQLTNRVVALIDNVSVGLSLSRVLKQVVAVRELTTRRMQGLLETAGVLRGQRKLAEITPLRRVS